MGTMPPEAASVFDLISLLSNPDAYKKRLQDFTDLQQGFETQRADLQKAAAQSSSDREAAETLAASTKLSLDDLVKREAKLVDDKAQFEAARSARQESLNSLSRELADREAAVQVREDFTSSKAENLEVREAAATEKEEVLWSREAAIAVSTKELQEKLIKLKAIAA